MTAAMLLLCCSRKVTLEPVCLFYSVLQHRKTPLEHIEKKRCRPERLCVCPAANYHRKPSVLMVDELLCAYPHQLSFSEAGMRIMITSHFSPRTRLTMASRMLITEVTEVTLLVLSFIKGRI